MVDAIASSFRKAGLIPFEEQEIRRFEEMGAWGEETLWEQFQKNASATPDALALIDDPRRAEFTWGSAQRLNYDEAVVEVDAMAIVMRDLGLQPGDIIFYYLPNVIEQAIILLAAWRCGIIVSPLLPQFQSKEILEIFDAAKPKAIFTADRLGKSALAERIKATLADKYDGPILVYGNTPSGCVSLEGLVTRAKSVTGDALTDLEAIDPNAAATICWTSGTEGTPKGVVRTHNNWNVTSLSVCQGGQLEKGERLLNPFPFVNMASIGGVFTTWLRSGGSFSQHIPFNLDALLDQIEADQISYTVLAPAILTRIANSEKFKSGKLDSLRALGTGSAPIDGAIIVKYEDELGIKITNLFGSNEGTSLSSGPIDCPDPFARASSFPRVGRPEFEWRVSNANWIKSKLVDTESGEEITATGESGVLLIKGPSLFPGYYRDGRIDRSDFDSDGYFSTGDLFEIGEEDDVQNQYRFVGRHKDIIIRGGMNIAPTELDLLLMEHPQLVEGAVASYPDDELGERVCACIVPHDGVDIGLDDIIEYLTTKNMARYKLPERMIVIEAVPRNAMQKIERHTLRDIIAGFDRLDNAEVVA